jgi:hypothetical protein
MVDPPHAMLISDDHHDYYRGKTLPILPNDPAESAKVNPAGSPGGGAGPRAADETGGDT